MLGIFTGRLHVCTCVVVFSQQPAHARLFGSSHCLAWTQSARRLRESGAGPAVRSASPCAPLGSSPACVRVRLVVAVAPGLIVSRFCPLSW